MSDMDKMLSRFRNKLTAADGPAATSDYFRFKGFESAVQLAKNLAFGVDSDNITQQTEDFIIRHDQREDTPTNDTFEDE